MKIWEIILAVWEREREREWKFINNRKGEW